MTSSVLRGPAVAPLSIGGSAVDAISQAIAINQRLLGGQRQANDNRFWASSPRYGSDPLREVFTLTLTAQQEINFLSLELARFPSRTWVQWYDESDPSNPLWRDALDLHTVAPVAFTITDSIPAQFLATADPQNKIHPQHYGAGHWVNYKTTFRTVNTSRMRLVLARVPGAVPVDRAGSAVPYSLGVRNCFFGFDATTTNLVPRTPFITETEHKSFASSVDSLRSTLTYSLRENQAHAILTGGIWRSEPQPIRNAVVNFYVDARDGFGDRQVIDRFFVDPLYTGPKINLYYSDSVTPLLSGEASDRPLLNEVRPGVGVDGSGTGLALSDINGRIKIDNAGVRFDLRDPWWIGITFAPQFDSLSPVDRYILSAGANNAAGAWVDDVLSLKWSGIDFSWVLSYGPFSTSLPATFTVNTQLNYALAFDGSSLALLSQSTINLPASPIPASPWVGSLSPEIYFGTSTARTDIDAGNYRLLHLVMKNGLGTRGDFQTYFTGAVDYVVKKPYPYEDDNSTNGSVLRYDDTFKTINTLTGEGFWGFVGEPLIDYESLVWTPVNRDFDARRGLWQFNPVKAAAFKFEFYDLSPQNYDCQKVLTRTVRLFPLNTPVFTTPPPKLPTVQPMSALKGGPGVVINVDQGPSAAIFNDSVNIGSMRENPFVGPFSPTEAMYAEDPTLAEAMRLGGSSTNYMRLMPSPGRFRFPRQQPHYYRYVDVKHDHKVAFFAGLKSLAMYRVDYIAEDDTDQYLEVFHDDVHFGPATDIPGVLNFQPGSGVYSDQADSSLTVQAVQSTVFASHRRVRAVQFAATQSDSYQMLLNPDFDDVSLIGWRPAGDAVIEASTTYNSSIGTTVKVSRAASANTWDTITGHDGNPSFIPLYPTWDSIEAAGETWDLLSFQTIATSSSGGITCTDFQDPSPIGRMYAAARVYSPETLSWPLTLQIVSDSGQVLAQAEKSVIAGSVTEWYVGYTINEGGATDGHTWDEVEGLYPTWDAIEGALWRDIEASTLSLVGKIGARLIQTMPTNDSWYVDNISLFDDPIVWDFSGDGGANWYPAFDIRNNPRGILVFPTPGRDLRWRVRIGRGGSWVSALDIRPMYAELPMGIAYREGVERGNGNVGHWDHFNPILVDPRFKMWDKPVPEWWFFVNRQWLLRQTPAGPITSTALRESLVAGGTIVEPIYAEPVIVIPSSEGSIVLGEVLQAP